MEKVVNTTVSSGASSVKLQNDIHPLNLSGIREKTVVQLEVPEECVPKVEPVNHVSSGKKESLKRLLSQIISESEGKR